ncbi:MAG: hypothetical protein ACOYKZ_00775 [Chlamydiia bacterium]
MLSAVHSLAHRAPQTATLLEAGSRAISTSSSGREPALGVVQWLDWRDVQLVGAHWDSTDPSAPHFDVLASDFMAAGTAKDAYRKAVVCLETLGGSLMGRGHEREIKSGDHVSMVPTRSYETYSKVNCEPLTRCPPTEIVYPQSREINWERLHKLLANRLGESHPLGRLRSLIEAAVSLSEIDEAFHALVQAWHSPAIRDPGCYGHPTGVIKLVAAPPSAFKLVDQNGLPAIHVVSRETRSLGFYHLGNLSQHRPSVTGHSGRRFSTQACREEKTQHKVGKAQAKAMNQMTHRGAQLDHRRGQR